MSQRNSGYSRKARDLYETPSWVTKALIPHLPRPIHRFWEPACASGQIVKELYRIGGEVRCSDIEPIGSINAVKSNFLLEETAHNTEAIITNPPFNLATKFCEHSLWLMKENMGMVALLLRTDFDHAKTRSHLFKNCPMFAKKVVLTKRIMWFDPGPNKKGKSPSYNHAWFIWDYQHRGAPTIAYGS